MWTVRCEVGRDGTCAKYEYYYNNKRHIVYVPDVRAGKIPFRNCLKYDASPFPLELEILIDKRTGKHKILDTSGKSNNISKVTLVITIILAYYIIVKITGVNLFLN